MPLILNARLEQPILGGRYLKTVVFLIIQAGNPVLPGN